MSNHLFFSPAASGKTAYALNLARQTAASLQHAVRICVPTGLQAQSWRQRLAATGGSLGVHVLTFDKLVATCLNEANEAYTQLSDPVQYRLLRTVINEVSLQHYAPLKAKPGFIQISQHLITELKSALVTPAAFTDAIAQMGDAPRLRELAAIYTAYQNRLRDQRWADRVGLHWLAVEALGERAPDACRDWPLLIVDGFDDFTPSQLALLALLANRVQDCVVTLPLAEQVSYPRYQKTLEAMAAALGLVGSALPETEYVNTSHPTLCYLGRYLFTSSAGDPITDEDAVTLHEVPDRAGEVRTALRWLKQRVVWEDIPANQVALLARDITPYRPFIQQAATEFGLPIRLVDGQPLQQSPVITALLALLRLYLPFNEIGEPSLSRRQVIAAWRSPYFYWGGEETSITPADADLLDTFARQQLIIRGLTQWQDAFVASTVAEASAASDVYEEDEAGGGTRLTGTLIQRLQQKFNHFLTLSQPPATATTMRDFVQWLEALIGLDPQAPGNNPQPDGSLQIVMQARNNPTTASSDVAALCTLKDVLRGLVWAEAAVSQAGSVDYALFLSELMGVITATHYMLPSRPDQHEILVASVTQVRGLSFAAVAIMGLSEGAFPATISEDPFLRDADRRILRDQFAFQLEMSTQSAEREFFYEAVTRARDKLLLTRPILADNGAEWVASPYWETTRSLVAVEPQLIGSTAVLPLAETASWIEWWETIAATGTSTLATQTWDDDIQRQIDTAAAIWQMRQAGEMSIWQGDLFPLADELASRFGPDHVWSASRLEAYQTCGYLFFLQSVLGIEPRPEPAEGLDIRQLGNVYHNIFEQVTSNRLPEPLAETAVREYVVAIAAPILDAAPTKWGFRQTPWWTQTRQEIIDNVTRSVMALAVGEFTFFRAEAAFGIHGPPLIISEGDAHLRLRGFIDRVDRRDDGTIRIIDYKSSGKSAYTFTAFQNGKKLQLPLYALAAQETLGLGVVSDGFYWHFQQAESSSFQLQKAKEGIDGVIQIAIAHAWEAVKNIRNGQFAPRPPDGGCPAYCPAASFCWQYVSGRR